MAYIIQYNQYVMIIIVPDAGVSFILFYYVKQVLRRRGEASREFKSLMDQDSVIAEDHQKDDVIFIFMLMCRNGLR